MTGNAFVSKGSTTPMHEARYRRILSEAQKASKNKPPPAELDEIMRTILKAPPQHKTPSHKEDRTTEEEADDTK